MPPNILLITADDMNWDAVGAYGCPTSGTTPNLDRLAGEGIRFEHSHVTIAVCQPSRSVLMSGRYPHRSGGEGFHKLRRPGLPILPALLREAGYRVGILGKVGHSTPYEDFEWDLTVDRRDLGQGRSPSVYAAHTRSFLDAARKEGRPFFLMLNAHDPHRPFVNADVPEWYTSTEPPPAEPPSRIFAPAQVVTPGFLPDLPEVRHEIADYYSSVRRCDDTVGAALAELEAAGQSEHTLVSFLSDNGMAFPFAKTNCYLHSTRTPWILRWPGVTEPGTVDARHGISGVDWLPTVLDAVGLPRPGDLDGQSFLPLLRGESQDGRDYVFTQFHQNAMRLNYPIRAVQDRRFGYLFNPWSNGTRVFRNESQSGRTFKAMQAAAASDPQIADRVDLFLHRVPEELYDFQNDPDALHNRIDDPACDEVLKTLRAELENWMERTGDPALGAFRNRQSPEAREAFVQETVHQLGGSV